MRYWVVFFLLSCLLSCHSPTPPKHITKAFYYWKSTVQLSDKERIGLDSNHVHKLYVKFFDVDWQQAPAPKAIVHFQDSVLLKSCEIVPVVYITNRTLLNANVAQTDTLAKQIHQKINQLAQKYSIRFNEIQLDCDWSPKSQRKYFRLLNQLKKQFRPDLTLSATIRLHQIKYADQTGIPPVDRGMLMCYNVADWKNANTKNSIFDTEVIGSYLGNLDAYPLPLDVALPLFRWAAIYRNNRFVAFVNNLDNQNIRNYSFFQKTKEPNRFIVSTDTSALGLSLRRGDLFRTEAANFNDLLITIEVLRKRIQNQNLTFALYHLDQPTLKFYSDDQVSQLFQAFK